MRFIFFHSPADKSVQRIGLSACGVAHEISRMEWEVKLNGAWLPSGTLKTLFYEQLEFQKEGEIGLRRLGMRIHTDLISFSLKKTSRTKACSRLK
jgi:hypothetical protein